MFGGAFFGNTYYGDTYFGPVIEVAVVVVPKKKYETSVSGAEEDYTVRKVQVAKEDLSKSKKAIIAQLMQEDEELIAVIVTAIEAGII